MSSPAEAAARPADLDRCPCGGGSYGNCCGPALDGGVPPVTAVALMRSRYTAFALQRPGYLLETWHPSTRPDSLELDDDVQWRHLLIIDSVAGGAADRDGVVEFRAV